MTDENEKQIIKQLAEISNSEARQAKALEDIRDLLLKQDLARKQGPARPLR